MELINANPTYANVRLQNGRELDVNVRDVAPLPNRVLDNDTTANNIDTVDHIESPSVHVELRNDTGDENSRGSDRETNIVQQEDTAPQTKGSERSWLRHSTRYRKTVQRYGTATDN